MRINNNVAAFNANRNLSTSNMSLGKSLEKLSSGFRINRAGDDAAGLVISQGLRAQASGLQQATRNAQDGISVVQTAEGALTEVHSMLNRMRDLAVQSANTGSNDADAIAASQAEYDELSSEITRISGATKFGSKSLLDGTFGNLNGTTGTEAAFDDNTGAVGGTMNITYGADDTALAVTITAGGTAKEMVDEINGQFKDAGLGLRASVAISPNGATFSIAGPETFDVVDGADDLSIADAAASAVTGTGGAFQVGANSGEQINVSIGAMDATTLGIATGDLAADAGAAIEALDAAIADVSTLRGELGAKQNRFESTINNLQVSNENIVASESRIRDTDMATEMTNFTKQQILQQAGTAMLGQANSLPQGVLRLLG